MTNKKNYLDAGYIYTPYIPIQVTPTIFGPEDFTARPGIMTRYGKKFVPFPSPFRQKKQLELFDDD